MKRARCDAGDDGMLQSIASAQCASLGFHAERAAWCATGQSGAVVVQALPVLVKGRTRGAERGRFLPGAWIAWSAAQEPVCDPQRDRERAL